MAIQRSTIFTGWDFESADELRRAYLLPEDNYRLIQNELTVAGERKMAIEADLTNQNYLLEHKFYEGMMAAYQLLLGYSDNAKSEMQKALEASRLSAEALNQHLAR